MLILWVFLAQVVSGQNIGAVLAEKQQEITTGLRILLQYRRNSDGLAIVAEVLG